MAARTDRRILVVQRDWPQQENPELPLLAADAPAVLSGRVASATAPLPVDAADLADLVARLRSAVADPALDPALDLPDDAVLQAVCDHAVRAAGDAGGELRLVAADLGGATLLYALLTPIALAPGADAS